MKKILLVILTWFVFSSTVFAVDVPVCKSFLCLQKQMTELVEENKSLRKQNEELVRKYDSFNTSLESYIKILAESKSLSEYKTDAYDTAINEIKYWFWIISWIIVAILWFFWYRSWPELKNSIAEKVKKDIVIDTDKKIDDKIENNKKIIDKDIEIAIARLDGKIDYEKLKDIEKRVIDTLEPKILNKTEELFNSSIDGKVAEKLREVLLNQ